MSTPRRKEAIAEVERRGCIKASPEVQAVLAKLSPKDIKILGSLTDGAYTAGHKDGYEQAVIDEAHARDCAERGELR